MPHLRTANRFLLHVEYSGKGASLDHKIEQIIGKPRSSSNYTTINRLRDIKFSFEKREFRDAAVLRIRSDGHLSDVVSYRTVDKE